MKRGPTVLLVSLAAAVILACQAPNEGGSFHLYRSSAADSGGRIYMATFDAPDGAEYNRENCERAAALFGEQPGVTVRFWCEAVGE